MADRPAWTTLARIGWTRQEIARRLGCHHSLVAQWERKGAPDIIAWWLVEIANAIEANPPPDWRRHP